MKKYLNFDGLTHFLSNLSNKFATKDELSAAQEDVITEDEIDEICGGVVEEALSQTDIDELQAQLEQGG